MSDSVVVEQSASGEWWRMSYGGETDLVDEEPTDAVKLRFMQSVVEGKRRRAFETKMRAQVQEHGGRMVESVDGRTWSNTGG